MARNDNASRAAQALVAAAQYSPGNDEETAISDLVCDLRHAVDTLADSTWEGVLHRAYDHYECEIEEELDALTLSDLYDACKSDGDYAILDELKRQAIELKRQSAVSATGGA